MPSAVRVLATLSLVVWGSVSEATVIEFDVTNVADATWRYDYTITNDTLGAPLEEFTVFFDRTLYANLSVADSPESWDSIVAQPDLNLPDDGFFDSLALIGGIGIGQALGGFSVLFDWLGQGAPGEQVFDVVDALTVDTLESGTTSLRRLRVSEPTTIYLLALALVGLSFGRRRRCRA